MFKKNYKKGIFTVVGAVAIVTVGGAYLWTRTIGNIGKEFTPMEAAAMVPDKAWMGTYISTNSESWSKLNETGYKIAENMVDRELDSLSRQLLSKKINYDKDIDPWLGNIMIAKLPPDKKELTLEPENLNVLAVIGIKDKLKAAMFIKNKIQSGANQNDINSFKTRRYKGVLIIETKTQTNAPLDIASIDDRLIMASDSETMNQAIDTMQGGPSFVDKLERQKIRLKNSSKETALIRIYMPDYATLMKTSLRSSPKTRLAARSLDKINDVEAIMMGLSVNERGLLHFQTLAKLDPEENQANTRIIPNEILSYLPNNTIALLNVGKLDIAWSSLLSTAAKDRIVKFNFNKYKKSFETSMNLDLERDVFSWMDGEFAVAVIPTNRGFLADYGLSAVAMWTTSQRSRAEETLEKLEAKAQSFKDISVRTSTVNGKEITEWLNFRGEKVLSYRWLNDKYLILTVGTPPDRTTNIQANNSISKDKTFTTIASYLPKTNEGYFYINNFDTIIEVLDRVFEDQSDSVTPEARAALSSVEAIALTTSVPKPFFSQLDIVMSFKSANTK